MLASLLLCLPVSAPPQVQAAGPIAESHTRLPNLGVVLHERRFLDREGATVRIVATLDDGTLVDPTALRDEERRTAQAARGGISPELFELMGGAAPGTALPVVFWLRADQAPDFRALLENAEAAGADPEDARRLARDAAADWHAPRLQAFAERLTAAGIAVTQLGGAWPIVFADVPSEAIATWAADPVVDRAYRVFPEWYPELDNAQGTMRTPTVWARGIVGAGSPVKTMVNDVGDVVSNNPYLPPITYLTSIGVSTHATAVAGNIAMNHPTLKGAAYGLPQLYSGGGSGDSAAPVVWNAAITAGVSFGNCSWWNGSKGSIVFLDRFFDYTLRNFGVMMFKSTGNQGNTSTPYTTTPGNAYNVTCSGSYNDGNDVDWANDAMASYSSYWDPAEGHEKPEVASAGDDVDTAGTSNPWTASGFNGTSSASPLTAGVATLLATRDPALRTRPETVKAVLMVSAWHNVEGSDVLSEYDGAGGVHAAAADAVLRDGQFVNGTLTNASFTAGNFDVPFLAFAGDETRVIGLWFSNANAAGTTDTLEMDVDLLVLDPNGATVAASASAFNPFEIAKFTPSTTGTHTIRLVRQRFNGASEPFCVAWSSRQDAAVAGIEVTGTPQPGAPLTLTFREPYDPGAYFQAHVSPATLPNVVGLAGGHVLPLKANALFTSSGGWSGFSGTLNGAGNAQTTRNVPNNVALIGRTFWVAMYTKPNAASGVISGTSAAVPVTVVP